MAGRHRKRSRVRASIARGGTGLASAAIGATSVTTAVVTGTTPAIAPAVDLMAVITPANSTSQFFAGTKYYGVDYTQPPRFAGYGSVRITVPFLAGPQGIANAINEQSADPNDPRNIVLASGWAAGQTGTALNSLTQRSKDLSFFLLDNNTNRPGGGFWTTYSAFAPLFGTSSAPTPDVPFVFDVGYKYNINSDAPTYPANVVSLGNSLAAYIYGYGGEQTAMMPNTGLTGGTHYIVNEDTGEIIRTIPLNSAGNPPDYTYEINDDGTIDGTENPAPGAPDDVVMVFMTFVNDDGLPILRPLKLIPGGDIFAAALDPVMTDIVDAGYKDNEPIPDNPSQTRTMGLLPIAETATMINRLPGDAVKGLQDGVRTAVATSPIRPTSSPSPSTSSRSCP